ncbi:MULTISPECIES: VWA domain-containing protein [unclassified Sinorhizobium]|uniref:vWA domain-containing protein n=1 Tax=unclassified Sinorhizobium TaxID=2613772 RepID=UPI0024C368EE|nr:MULTISPECIES: VWA domain-containing protein [unclassified Sinorhizobium]MDK1377891.1 VWA domain-containing protein [Sinorhizobium sp. 6-70]MDK1481438.1 VWA domain-containing protein [Sinorhizobium sp. 6-117]
MYVLDHPWLLFLLALPFLVWWLLPPYREHTPAVRIPFFKDITDAAGVGATEGSVVPRSNLGQKLIAPVCWGLIVLALARPQFIEQPIEKTEPQRDLMLAIDLSQSMDTRDFRDPDGNLEARVDAVHKVVADFIGRRPSDRLGLIAFGDAPYPLVPFTLDHQTVEAILADSLPGMAGPRTALGDAIGLAIKMFDQSEAPDKVLIVLTDGNDTASKMPPDKAADIAGERRITIHAVGIGDPNAEGEQKLDTTVLQQIATKTGGHYFFGQDQVGLETIYGLLDQLTPANQKTLSWRPRIELFYYPLGASLIIVVAYHAIMWLLSSGGAARRESEVGR